jgi:hypothetical protein
MLGIDWHEWISGGNLKCVKTKSVYILFILEIHFDFCLYLRPEGVLRQMTYINPLSTIENPMLLLIFMNERNQTFNKDHIWIKYPKTPNYQYRNCPVDGRYIWVRQTNLINIWSLGIRTCSNLRTPLSIVLYAPFPNFIPISPTVMPGRGKWSSRLRSWTMKPSNIPIGQIVN